MTEKILAPTLEEVWEAADELITDDIRCACDGRGRCHLCKSRAVIIRWTHEDMKKSEAQAKAALEIVRVAKRFQERGYESGADEMNHALRSGFKAGL